MIKRKSNRLKRDKKTQKNFLMKGCSKNNTRKNKREKNIRGGRPIDMTNSKDNLIFIEPNKGSVPTKFLNFINPQLSQVGGNKKMKDGKGLMQNGGYSSNASIAKWFGDNDTKNYQNFIPYNNFKNSLTTSIINTGANRPFLGGRKTKTNTKTRKNKQKGGAATFSNSLTQDLVNLGRQLQYNVGSAYNAINGYRPPLSPLPWKQHIK